MKRLLSFVYALLVGSMTLWAVHINENAARQIAASFMDKEALQQAISRVLLP